MQLPQRIYGLYVWTVFGLTSAATLLLLLVIPGLHRRQQLARGAAALVFRLAAIRVHISGWENLPDRSCVIAANHASYLDGVLLTAVLPAGFQFVIKREMENVPLAGRFLKRVGSQFVDRFNPHKAASDARRIMQLVDTGSSMVFFPEGTFVLEPGLQKFHKGAFRTAYRAGLEVVPIAIRGSRQMLPADRWLPRTGTLHVNIHPPVHGGNSVAEILNECRNVILKDTGEPDHNK
jgi:1-acyl-sn-glycerol-3-phosphate acyltransferase